MKELLILLMIGLSLSIDAFSVSTVIGMTNLSHKKTILTSSIVGVYHFIMPLLGVFLSNQITKIISINSNLVLGIVLLIISMQMFIEFINPSKKEMSLSFIGIIIFGLGVSIDSFTIGLGLRAITNSVLLASFLFSSCSFIFTYLGLSLGKYISKMLKKYSYLIGTIILFLLGISFLCKIN